MPAAIQNQTPRSPSAPTRALGTHALIELNQCPGALLRDREKLEALLIDSATQAGAHVVESVFHQFNPHGLSGVVVIAESHITVHTWPEHGYAAIDVFTCGDPAIARRIQDRIIEGFAPAMATVQTITRGPSLRSRKPAALWSAAAERSADAALVVPGDADVSGTPGGNPTPSRSGSQ